jgi:hypothetical protein
MRSELLAPRPDQCSKPLHRCVRAITVGKHGHTEMGHIGINETWSNGCGDNVTPLFDPVQFGHDLAHRLGFRALHLRHGQHRQFTERLVRSRLAVQQTAQKLRCLAPALGHVNVWQRVIADQNIGSIHQRRTDVPVQIEGDDQRDFRSDRVAHSIHDVGIGFVDTLCHHRAVDCQQHAIEVALSGTVSDRANQMIERGAAYQSGRDGAGEQRRHKLKVLPRRLVDEATDLCVRAVVCGE